MKKFLLFALIAFNSVANPDLIFKNLSSFIDGMDKNNIEKTEISGIYEVITTNPIDSIFVSNDGRFIIQGDIIDLQKRAQITKNSKVKKLVKKELDSIKDNDKIIFKAKKEKYSIDVFTDVDCPFCSKLHAEVSKLNDLGVSVKYIASPLASLHPKAQEQMEKIWCATNRVKAMDDYKKNRTVPNSKNCKNPVTDQLKIATKIGVRGTPSIFLSDGTNISGYLPTKNLFQRIKNIQK